MDDNFEKIRKKIQELLKLLPDHSTSHVDAEDKAALFLRAQHKMAEIILSLEIEYNEARSVGKLLYNNALLKSEAKNATEKKAGAEADFDYNRSNRQENNIKTKITYIKTHLSIFNDAHLSCRQIAREK